MKNSSFEDSLILTRSAYECYVNAGAVLNTPELVDQLIRVRLALFIKLNKHPLSNKGRPVRNKVIDWRTGNTIGYGHSLKALVAKTKSTNDQQTHALFYEFLCQFTHADFVSVDSYKTEYNSEFTACETPHMKHGSLLVSSYTSWLMLDLLIDFLKFLGQSPKLYEPFHFEFGGIISTAVSRTDFGNITDLKKAMEERLKESIN